jgi:hypothetical protein
VDKLPTIAKLPPVQAQQQLLEPEEQQALGQVSLRAQLEAEPRLPETREALRARRPELLALAQRQPKPEAKLPKRQMN